MSETNLLPVSLAGLNCVAFTHPRPSVVGCGLSPRGMAFGEEEGAKALSLVTDSLSPGETTDFLEER